MDPQLRQILQTLVNTTGADFAVSFEQTRRSVRLPRRHGPLRHIVISDIGDDCDAENVADDMLRSGGAHAVCHGDDCWMMCSPTRAVRYDAPHGVRDTYSLRVCVGRIGSASTLLLAALLQWTGTQDSMISHVLVYDGPRESKMSRGDDIIYRAISLHLMHKYISEPPPQPLPPMGQLTGAGCDGLDTGFRVYKLVDDETPEKERIFG